MRDFLADAMRTEPTVFSTMLNDLVRAQIRAVDMSAVNHWYITGHQVERTLVPAGWVCSECEASFAIKPQEFGP